MIKSSQYFADAECAVALDLEAGTGQGFSQWYMGSTTHRLTVQKRTSTPAAASTRDAPLAMRARGSSRSYLAFHPRRNPPLVR